MAISLGTTSEQLLRGFDRLVASVATALPLRMGGRQPRISRAWAAERGRDTLIAQVDIAGGFPGSLRWQNALSDTTLHLTDRNLIVGEGTSSGFALPLDRIGGTALQGTGGIKPPYLTIWFQDGNLIGSFSVSFRGTARGRSGLMRAEVWQQHLTETGIPQVETEIARFAPNLHVDWDDIADFVDDEVIFSGSAIASVGGWFGSDLDSADVWITERNIIWCARHGKGVNRLDMDDIIDARNGFGDRLAIGIEDACGGRYDLFFDFANKHEREHQAGRVLHMLNALGVPVSTPSLANAPWRRGGTRRPSDI